MSISDVTLFLDKAGNRREISGVRVAFNPTIFLANKDDPTVREALSALATHILEQSNVAWVGTGPLQAVLLDICPDLNAHIKATIDQPENTPDNITVIVNTEIDYWSRQRCIFRCPERITLIDASEIAKISRDKLPPSCWSPIGSNIYPIDLPDISFRKNLDLLLMDCPARNLALMPNGLAYVHNALTKTDVNFQTFDLDIIAYHRFHMRRIYDEGGTVNLADGRLLPEDPWQAEHYDLWSDRAMMACFGDILELAVNAVLEAAPKILALSVHGCNEMFSRELIRRVKAGIPDVVVLVGGFSCYNAEIGLKSVPETDYMCIGESDLTVGPLVESLARGERPRNLPGVLSYNDSKDRLFIPAPMPHNLDNLDFPRYEWFDLAIYRNYNGYQLTPVIASRGCRWSRCTFCAERFYWRIRSPKNFVDELEWLFSKGCTLFMFNESDLNGMPEVLLEIADEIIRRGLKLKLTGQLRIHKKSDRHFFEKLAEAGFVALRFGVDAFSKNALRLQMKGYTPDIIRQNLKDCWEAGIFTEVNWVIGVPGETDDDIAEGIDLILENQKYIGRLANINPLILSAGSVYWLEPDVHGIKFEEPKEELYARFPRAIPADKWFSEEPFIDARIRKKWFEQIVIRLYEGGFDVGAWAERIINDVKTARDKNRSIDDDPAESNADSATDDIDTMDGAKKKGKGGKPVMRAGSALGSDTQVSSLPEHMQVIEFDDQFFAFNRHHPHQTFKTTRKNLPKRRPPLPEAVRHPRNFTTKFFSKLPEDLQYALVRAYREERARLGNQEMPSSTLASGMMIRGMIRRVLLSALHATGLRSRPIHNNPTLISNDGTQLIYAIGKDQTPMLMCTIGNYNIVEFGGDFFGIPQGQAIDWETGTVHLMPHVVRGKTVLEVMNALRDEYNVTMPENIVAATTENITGPAGQLHTLPTEIATANGYRIISYEGWVYGIPESHGDVDITIVDPLDLDGVIQDVSVDVVQSEIAEANSTKAHAVNA